MLSHYSATTLGNDATPTQQRPRKLKASIQLSRRLAVPTDQKVGGSTPSERTRVRLSARGAVGTVSRHQMCRRVNSDVPSTVALVVLALVSGLSFLFYGFKVLFQSASRSEFERFGVPAVRRLVGVMELLGGAGVLLGLVVAPLGALAAGGLAALMILGLIVRIRVHDAVRLMVPAALLGAVNVVLVVLFVA